MPINMNIWVIKRRGSQHCVPPAMPRQNEVFFAVYSDHGVIYLAEDLSSSSSITIADPASIDVLPTRTRSSSVASVPSCIFRARILAQTACEVINTTNGCFSSSRPESASLMISHILPIARIA